MCGTGVYHTNNLAPPLSENNDNIFHRGFGIEFDLRLNEDMHVISNKSTHRTIRPISPFEYSQMFYLVDKLGIKLAESEFFHLLQDGILGRTSYALTMCVYDRLLD